MRVLSRELIVGFLLVLALVASGCLPVQPPAETAATPTSETVVESEPLTDTATLVESTLITESTADTTTTTITATSVITTTVVVTDTAEVTETVATSVTEETTPAEPAASVDPAVLAAGLAVYRAQYCGVCHTLDAAETRGTFGPPHNGLGATAAEFLADGTYRGVATTPAEYIRESIVDPPAFIVPGYATTSHRMPSYAHLDAASLDALVAFLLAQ